MLLFLNYVEILRTGQHAPSGGGNEILEGTPLSYDNNTHLCFKCRKNLKSHLDIIGRQYKEVCPYCGTLVMFPMLPP
jgi:hypothetical protein